MGFVVDFVDSAVSAVVGAVDDVATAVTNTVKAAIKDPVKTIAQVAAVATGNTWALPLIEGADVAYAGGSIGDVAKAIVVSDLTQGVAKGISESVGTELSDALGKTGATIAAQGTANAAVAVIRGRDPLQAFVSGGISAAVPAVLGKVDAFTDLPPMAQRAIQSTVAASLTEQDVSGALINSLVQSSNLTAKILKSVDPEGTMFTAGQSAVLGNTLMSGISASLSGRDASAAMQSALFNAGTQAVKQFVKNDFKTSVDGVTNAWSQAQEQKQKLNSNAEQQATLASEYAKTANELNAKVDTQQQLFDAQQKLRDEYSALAGQGASAEVLNQKVEALDAATQKYNDYATSLKQEYERTYSPILNSKAQEIEQLKSNRAIVEQSYNAAINSVNKASKPVEDVANQISEKTKEFAVAELNPEFNSEAYAKLNNVTGNAYEHYLSTGYETKLPTSYESGAKAALKSIGYDASADEVKQVADLFKQSANPDVALDKFYDERTVTQDELSQFQKDTGVSLTAEQQTSLTGKINESDVLSDLMKLSQVNKQDATAKESRSNYLLEQATKAYQDEGYPPELAQQFAQQNLASLSQADAKSIQDKTDYAAYLKSRYGTDSPKYREAAQDLLEAKASVGGYGVVKDQSGAYKTTSGATIDPASFKTVTDLATSTLKGAAESALDFLVPSAQASGKDRVVLPQPTDTKEAAWEDYKFFFDLHAKPDPQAAYAGLSPEQKAAYERASREFQGSSEDRQKEALLAYRRGATSTSGPSEQDILETLKSQSAEQDEMAAALAALQGSAGAGYVTPQEAQGIATRLGYTPSGMDELLQFTGQKSQADIEKEIAKYIDPQMVTADEAIKAYLDLGLQSPTQSDITRFVGQRPQNELSKQISSYLPVASANAATAASNRQMDIGNLFGLMGLMQANQPKKETPIPLVGEIKPYDFTSDLLAGVYKPNTMNQYQANDQLLNIARGQP